MFAETYRMTSWLGEGRSVPREETNTQRGSGVEERGDTEALRYWKTQELSEE